jgi:hypothetical protein
MRYLPHQIYLMALRGRESVRGRPLPSKEEALTRLRRLTGQDFGPDPAVWSAWIKANRRGLYKGDQE